MTAVVVAGGLLAPARAQAPRFPPPPGTDPAESPRVHTPNDPDFDRCESDDEDTPAQRECTSYFEEAFRLFGFAPESSADYPNLADYKDREQLDEQGRAANRAAGRPEFGQIGGVRADTAWKYSTGRPDVSVAILDTGIRWEEKELVDKVRLNTAELPPPHGAAAHDANRDGRVSVSDYASDPRVGKAAGDTESDALLDASDLIATFSDGRDADGNGYVDDIAGWDFFDDDNNPFDASSCCSATNHGTARALEAVAETNDATGEPGMCPQCQFVPMRVWDSFVVDTNLFALATVYAADNGVAVVEGAVAGLVNSSFARRAFSYADARGVAMTLVSSDINSANHSYPTNYTEAIYVGGSIPDTAPSDNCQLPGIPGIGGPRAPLPGCNPFLELLRQGTGGAVRASSQPPTTSFFRNSNLTQYGGKADIVLMGSTGSINTGQAAGAAALIQAYGRQVFADQAQFPKTLSGNEVRQLMTMTAEDVRPGNTGQIGLPDKAAAGWDPHFGYGRLNLAAAMARIKARRIPPEAQLDAPDWFAPINVDRVGAAGVPVTGRTAAPHSAAGVGAWELEYACGQDATDAAFKPLASGSGERLGQLGVLSRALLVELATTCRGDISDDAGLPAGERGRAWPADPYPGPDPMRHAFQVRLTVRDASDRANVGRYRKTLFAYRDDGNLPGWPQAMGRGASNRRLVSATGGEAPPRLVDLDGDNRLDVLMATSSGELFALDARGRPLPSFNRGRPVLTGVYAQASAHSGGIGLADLPREALRAPAVGDLTGDGEPELVSTAGQHVYAWHRDGRRVANFPRRIDPALSAPCKAGVPSPCFDAAQRAIHRGNHIKRGFIGSPALADLDEDGRLDIVAGSLDQHVYAWNARGAMLPGFPAKLAVPDAEAGAEIVNSPTIADLDGDDDPEVVLATNEVAGGDGVPNSPEDLLSAFAAQATGAAVVHAIHGDGKPVRGWPVKLGSLTPDILPLVVPGHDAAAVDVDGDGDDEVSVSATAAGARLVDGDGKTIRSYQTVPTGTGNVTDPGPELNVVEYPAVGDLTGTGRPAVVKGGLSLNGAVNLLAVNQNLPFNHTVQAWEPRSGNYLPGFPVATDDYQLLSQPAIAKVDAAGAGRHALVGTGLYQLHAYGPTGAEPAGWPKFTGGWIFATPSVGDMDGDGRLEVMTVTREGFAFAWKTRAPACQAGATSTNREWWTFHHDEHGTANYGTDARPPSRPGALAARRERGGSLRLSFAASGDDLACGAPRRYDVRAASRPITSGARFGRARRLTSRPVAAAAQAERPASAGRTQTLVATGAGSLRHVAVRAVDDAGNVSYVRATTLPRAQVRRGGGGDAGDDRDRRPTGRGAASALGDGGRLPFTGLGLLLLVAVGVALLGLGAAARRRSRRRA